MCGTTGQADIEKLLEKYFQLQDIKRKNDVHIPKDILDAQEQSTKDVKEQK